MRHSVVSGLIPPLTVYISKSNSNYYEETDVLGHLPDGNDDGL